MYMDTCPQLTIYNYLYTTICSLYICHYYYFLQLQFLVVYLLHNSLNIEIALVLIKIHQHRMV